MNIEIEKSKIPILWIDTSVILKMALWKTGRPLNRTDQERIPPLYEQIYKLVREKKLICSFAGQNEEIWIGEKSCKEISMSLSLGIHFKHRQGIEDRQVFQFIKAFINKDNQIKLSYRDAFRSNPIQEEI